LAFYRKTKLKKKKKYFFSKSYLSRYPSLILLKIYYDRTIGQFCPVYKFWGFTPIELLTVLAIIGTIVGISVPLYVGYVDKARLNKAIAEIQNISLAIEMYKGVNEELPLSLSDAGCGDFIDPWGNPYQYLNFGTLKGSGKGKMRKDQFLVPINSDYDLYSKGKDGQSVSPLTAKASRDDIIRANDGRYIGPASGY
jgi:general secretion pathway protein G